MVKVYIASPYWHNNYVVRYENVVRQMKAADALLSEGYLAFWPLHSHFLAQHYQRTEEEWFTFSCEWLKNCDVLVRLSGESKGADMEVNLAMELEMPVFYGVDDLLKNGEEVIDNA